jgi:predicted DNA-binding transcriptional regulator YafY
MASISLYNPTESRKLREDNGYFGDMKKAERLLYILSLLRANKRLRARDLAQKCGVTERTIYRDVISISVSNIPIYFEDGYKLHNQPSIPPMNFSQLEARFLISLLSSPVLPGSKYCRKIADRILDKIQSSGVLHDDIITYEPDNTMPIKILSRQN